MKTPRSKTHAQARRPPRGWLWCLVLAFISVAGAIGWILHARHTPPPPVVPAQSYDQALEMAHDGKPGAARVLYQQLARSDLSDIRRAALLAELPNYPSTQALKLARVDLAGDARITRQAAIDAIVAMASRERRAQILGPLLDDGDADTRFPAALALLDLTPDELGLYFEPLREATAAYETSLAGQQENETSLRRLAMLYRHDGRWQQALDAARRAAHLVPENLEAILEQLEPLERLGQGEQAQGLLRELLEKHPQSSLLQHGLGQWLLAHDQQEFALLALARAVELAPDDIGYRYDLALALHGLGQEEPAQRQLQEVLQRHPACRRARVLLVNYWKEAGQLQNVQVLLAELEQQNPDDPALMAP